MNKKCLACGEVKSLMDFPKDRSKKDGIKIYCKKCNNKKRTEHRNTEKGYLKMRYNALSHSEFIDRKWGRKSKCYFTWNEFLGAWEKHKTIYGMRSAWGPGINNLEQHLPITIKQRGNGQIGKHGNSRGDSITGSNLSIDRLDPDRDYTLQNIIFIRSDENQRKKDTSYNDCKIQIKLHDERFVNMKSI